MTRLAYFIMAHHKPAQFEWLWRAIDDPRDLFLVHVDAKSRLGIKADRRGTYRHIRSLCAGRPNVRMMRSRLTNWGGWSLSRVLLDAIRLALREDAGWTHFLNLSGQCYPIKPIDRLRADLAAAGDAVHVELLPIAGLPADDWHHRAHPMLETPVRALILPGRKAEPRGFTVAHKGSQWVILPRAFCEWLAGAPLTRTVASYLGGRLLSDELLMQTLVVNGPWRERVAPHYGREIVWPGPKTMTQADLPRLAASPAWISRKFDVAIDPGVLDSLAASGGFTPGPTP